MPASPQIATLESELMQLMKQNGIQVNNNNSNSTERLSGQQQSPQTRGTPPPHEHLGMLEIQISSFLFCVLERSQ